MIHLNRLYVFGVMWSIGAILELDDRVKLESFMRDNLDLDLPTFEDGSNHTIFEYFVDKQGKDTAATYKEDCRPYLAVKLLVFLVCPLLFSVCLQTRLSAFHLARNLCLNGRFFECQTEVKW